MRAALRTSARTSAAPWASLAQGPANARRGITSAASGAAPLDNELSLGVASEAKNEVKDASLIFSSVWRNIKAEFDKEGRPIVFPREVVFYSGAPGAGKGSNAAVVQHQRDIDAVFEVSSLLNTPRFKEMKEAGLLVGDKDVVDAVIREILQPRYNDGVIVDGFPRTLVQAQCIQLLYSAFTEVAAKTGRKPRFLIVVLFTSERVSIQRQLARGQHLIKQNELALATGVGSVQQLRATDLSEEAARNRYRIFKEEVFGSLQAVRDHFPFRFINADGSPEEVKRLIVSELQYQSSLDLGAEAHELLLPIDDAASVIKQARSKLITRLNSYATSRKELFTSVINLIQKDFLHIIKRQALSGCAIIRSNHALLHDPVAVNMVLDILAERGYTVVLDVARSVIPSAVEPSEVPGEPMRVQTVTQRTLIFTVHFNKPEIRRAEM